MGLLDAISYVGDSIDKAGARPLRGLLGGKPREALSFIPFSDRVGITNPDDIVTGRHLTDKYGVTRKGDNSLGSHALGFGAEMALDPLNFVSGAGIAKHFARGGGRLTSHLDDIARSGGRLSPTADLSLGLKHDNLASHLEAGLSRSDPDWVNNRTFYHGTATHGLNPSNLDPLKTDPKGMFGRGIYTTDEGGQAVRNPSITSGYAQARHLKPPDNYRQIAESMFAERRAAHGADAAYPTLDEVIKSYPEYFGKPRIYQSQSDFGKILDVDHPPPRNVHDALTSTILDGGFDLPEELEDPGESAAAIIQWAKRMGANTPDDTHAPLDPIIAALKSQGYDALTHTGGGIVGKRPHQVVIGLDPNDVLKTGRATPYKQWSPFASLQPGADSDLSLHHLSPYRHQMILPYDGDESQAFIEAALRAGPMYQGGIGKLRQIADNLYPEHQIDIRSLLNSPYASRIAGEIPEDAKVIGNGAEGVIMSGHKGGVVRINNAVNPATFPRSYGNFPYEVGSPDIPEMLQPARTIRLGDYRVEHLPTVHPIYRGSDEELAQLARFTLAGSDPATLKDINRSLAKKVSGSGYLTQGLSQKIKQDHGLVPWDVHHEGHTNRTNVSLTNENRAIIHDRGAVWPSKIYKADQPELRHPFDLPEIDPALVRHLQESGTPEEIRRTIQAGLDYGTAGQGVNVQSIVPGLDPEALRHSVDLFNRLSDQFKSSSEAFGHRQPASSMSAVLGRTNVPNTWAGAPAYRNQSSRAADDILRGLGGGSDFSLGSSPLADAIQGGKGGGGLDPRFLDLGGRFKIHKNVPLLNPADAERGVQGLYKPKLNAGAVFQGAGNPGVVAREERGHGLVDQAIKAGPGAIIKLPAAWQPGAWAKYAGNDGGTLNQLGRYLDEVGQHATRVRGGNLDKLRGGVNFATSRPMATEYADHLAKDNPLLRALIMSGPYAAENKGKLALGALSGADLAKLSAAMNREE